MLELPKSTRKNKKNDDLCKCRPICKSRRRVWRGEVQNTSAELLLERKPLQECFRRWPTIVYKCLESKLVNAGVHQGWVLSTTLFFLHLNDMLYTPNIHCKPDEQGQTLELEERNLTRGRFAFISKVYANSPCPLLARTRGVILKSQDPPSVVRICQAPIDDAVDTPYLKYAELAKRLGAWQAVKSRCAFCSCCKCCGCGSSDYVLSEYCDNDRRRDMRAVDTRVKHNYQEMRIMYDNY